MLRILFPALAQTDEYLDLLGEPRLPGLDLLLARGSREAFPQMDMATLLCQEFGIVRQHDWPIAAITLAAAGEHAGNDYWLRADPVHVRIERDRVILSEIPAPDPEEARLLCEALGAHFGEEFSPQPLQPGIWVVRISGQLEISTTPLSLAAGQHIDPLLPAGNDALHWRKLLNEIQMLLFSHPVNQAREARGEAAINSVWLWGGGHLPKTVRQSSLTVLCDQPDWQALAAFSGAGTGTLPSKWRPDLAEDALIVMDAPHRHLRQGDLGAWLQAMQNFERDWLEPLLASGRPFQVDDPMQGVSLYWRSVYRWKFWRRAQKSVQQGFKLQQPAADPGVDAFGNRY